LSRGFVSRVCLPVCLPVAPLGSVQLVSSPACQFNSLAIAGSRGPLLFFVGGMHLATRLCG